VAAEVSNVHLIARAIIPLGREVVMLEMPGDRGNVLTLPGGTIRFGETGVDTLARLLRNQAGLEARVTRLVYAAEVFDGRALHEIGLYYLAELADDADMAADAPLALALQVVDPRTAVAPIEPRFLRALLIEDLETGFVRPVAHVVAWQSSGGVPPEVSVTW
jgi:ADP-ribose pyrophosphatase YjhB (NUDIX family)